MPPPPPSPPPSSPLLLPANTSPDAPPSPARPPPSPPSPGYPAALDIDAGLTEQSNLSTDGGGDAAHLTLLLAVGLPLLLCTALAALVSIRAAHKARANSTSMRRFQSMQRLSASALWSPPRGRGITTSSTCSSLDVDVIRAVVAGDADADADAGGAVVAPTTITSPGQVLVAEAVATQHPSTTLVASATVIPAAAALPAVARAVVVGEVVMGRPTATATALGVELGAFGASSSFGAAAASASSVSKHGGKSGVDGKLELDTKPADAKEAAPAHTGGSGGGGCSSSSSSSSAPGMMATIHRMDGAGTSAGRAPRGPRGGDPFPAHGVVDV